MASYGRRKKPTLRWTAMEGIIATANAFNIDLMRLDRCKVIDFGVDLVDLAAGRVAERRKRREARDRTVEEYLCVRNSGAE
jgi:hypothetical protein